MTISARYRTGADTPGISSEKTNGRGGGDTIVHPTQKPVRLLEYLICTYTDPGDTVLDFTMGSGSTGVACVRTGRNFIGIERDTDYFATAQKRIAEAVEIKELEDAQTTIGGM